MKRNIFFLSLISLMVFNACSPIEDLKVDLGNTVVLNNADYQVASTPGNPNTVQFKLVIDKAIPIWYFEGEAKPTNDRCFIRSYPYKGTYNVGLKVYNAAGISDSISIPFTVSQNDTSICNNLVFQRLTGGCDAQNGKVWIWDKTSVGHLASGAKGVDNNTPTWQASPNAFADKDMYDDSIRFVLNLNHDFTIYTNGRCFVNKAVARVLDPKSYPTTPATDVTINYPNMISKNWEVLKIGEKNYLRMPSSFPSYLADGKGFGTTPYRILELTDDVLILKLELANKNWYYKFIAKR